MIRHRHALAVAGQTNSAFRHEGCPCGTQRLVLSDGRTMGVATTPTPPSKEDRRVRTTARPYVLDDDPIWPVLATVAGAVLTLVVVSRRRRARS